MTVIQYWARSGVEYVPRILFFLGPCANSPGEPEIFQRGYDYHNEHWGASLSNHDCVRT